VLFLFFTGIESRSNVELVVSIPVEGDQAALQRIVDQLENNTDLKVELAQQTGLEIKSVELGSIVLRLIPLTDDACTRFLGEKGQHLKAVVEKLLIAGGMEEDMMKGNITVTVFATERENIGSEQQFCYKCIVLHISVANFDYGITKNMV
jgi:hypothetical protein